MKSNRGLWAAPLVGCIFWFASAHAQSPPAPASLAFEIERRLGTAALDRGKASGLPHSAVLHAFYILRAYRPAWVSGSGATAAAREIVDRLERAGDDGLVAADYSVKEIGTVIGASDPSGLIDFELTLSSAVIDFAQDARSGRVQPKDIEGTFIKPKPTDAFALLTEVAGATSPADFLDGLVPQSLAYARLRAALADYRARAKLGGWRPLPDGPTLKPGMSGEAVRALRQRLIEGGDLAAGAGAFLPAVFDEEIEIAVRRFQARHGLDVDGNVGPQTRRNLDIPVAGRIAQMLLNMERRRWMPDDLGETYVFVNLANFELKVVDGLKTIHDDRVVVGTGFNKSPVFSDNISHMILNPYWHIPPNIARNEMLAKVQADPNYLAANNIRVFNSWAESALPVDPATIDWKVLTRANFRFRLRQDAGPANALGRIKFMFPNRHNIYLHDTPARALFNRTVRSFSHGCIRVQHPIELAEVLLRDDERWPPGMIEKTIAAGERRVVDLRTKIPIHLTYLTAWVNKDGTIHFRDDIYGRDAALARALGLRRMEL